MANRYWVGGTGTWSTTSTANWSASSGGASGASVPTTADDVFFDSGSGTGTVTLQAGVTLNARNITANTANITITTTGTTLTMAAGTGGNGQLYLNNLASLTLGTSTITSGGWTFASGITLSAASSTITVASPVNTQFSGGGKTYGTVTLTPSAAITLSGNNTFSTLNLNAGATGTSYRIAHSASQTVTTLSVNSSGVNARRILLDGGTYSITSGSMAFANVRNVTISGSTITAANTCSDLLGNSGITFAAPVTRYAVVAGSWSNTATWSATSGGSGGATVPNTQDTAIFNASSGAGTYTMDGGYVGTITCTGFTRTLTFSVTTYLYGNLTFSAGMTYTPGASTIYIRAPLTINTAGKVLFANFYDILYLNTTGTINVSGSLDLGPGSIDTVTAGTFNGNAANINVGQINFSSGTLNMGSGTWTISGSNSGVGYTWSVGASVTFSAGTANIVLSNTSTNSRSFSGGGKTYNKLTIGGTTGTSTLTINGSNTFSEIASTKTVAHTILFEGGTTNTMGVWNVTGTSGNVVTLQSTNTSPATLAYSGVGTASSNYMNVSYITGSPALTWYMYDSTDGGNNTNITFLSTARPNGLLFGSNF